MKRYDYTTEWFYESKISTEIVNHLNAMGYTFEKDNSDKIQNKGEDIVAVKHNTRWVIEVKGYPANVITRGKRKGEPKKTRPDDQAKIWFGKALVGCMKFYRRHCNKQEKLKLAIALPKKKVYMDLAKEFSLFFRNFHINFFVLLVDKRGKIKKINLGAAK
ncbi:hypothetical protein GCM10007415_42030 [Parapedobacter pyrenivorans]|uniref:Uncharacterized protein n=1 Tax=Parapedobacter pyrenivorans TaxID=1305674 RepID=A0A917I0C6_9SPHI|nr:hypothetical protein [Parapedobacter pyrenivorans]GGH01493.1 hypothetical protein GCM10007415_42030 [Parapedobacter pyrenivorans]